MADKRTQSYINKYTSSNAPLEVSIKGFENLAQALKSFPQTVARRILSRSVYAGAVVVRDDARARAPVKTGKLRKSIKIKSAKSRRGTIEKVFRVYVAAYYGHMVERGTRAHRITRVNAKALKIGRDYIVEFEHRGATRKPFLRPALDENTRAIVDAMRDKLKAGIELYVRGPKLGRS